MVYKLVYFVGSAVCFCASAWLIFECFCRAVSGVDSQIAHSEFTGNFFMNEKLDPTTITHGELCLALDKASIQAGVSCTDQTP